MKNFFCKFLGRFVLFCSYLGILLALLYCEFSHSVLDRVSYWGEKDRRERQIKRKESDLRKWQRQLKMSRSQVISLEEKIVEMLGEEDLQGELARKIASSYLEKGRYDLASLYYRGALQKTLPKKKDSQASSYLAFEKSLDHFDRALLLHSKDPELFYEAGLAYANASRAQGWERKRFQIAVLLFERMRRLASQDIRPSYQLALLYGKTSLRKYRNRKYAIRLLKKVLLKKEKDIRARFALAHFFVEEGQLPQAIKEYEYIENTLENMRPKKTIQTHPSYRKARENKEKLRNCMRRQKACNF